ncbi:hypothetical phage protein [Escherichia phage wV7]|uniref:Hypothetical phage protein n=1 Tax=Escherichia phage wV7 TaxID=1054480 RepID=G0X5F3_9CAUD|nr:hypothetical protein F412_gp244 [Escherichia phage wV7]AEM00692.1 hypothetical phage protein [Escherichia phage wV7]AKE46045.1 hypothetical protein ECTP7_01178 [Escherichia coli O157 typing phage 7]
MSRLNKRQLKKLNKKRAKALIALLRNEITKEIDQEIIEQLWKAAKL